MAEGKKVSIIVPFYNTGKYLAKCLDSVLSQTHKNLEIICINDGSPDDSLAQLKTYAERDSRIKIIDKQNEGVSLARNAGLSYASGDYVMFVDSDDWIDEDTIEQMLSAAQKEDADAVMCCYAKEFSDHTDISHIFESDVVYRGDEVKNLIHRRLVGPIGRELSVPQNADILVTPCMQLLCTDICKKYKFFDIRELGTFEDGLYQIDIYREVGCFAYVDKPFYHYRKDNETSITTLYKADLYDKWQHLFSLIEEKCADLGDDYKTALSNRIALSMIGIGINETKAPKNIFKKASFLKQILKTPRYKGAYKSLNMKYFPIHWKVFFFLAKHRLTLGLMLMLGIIEFLRKR
ncbi:MAG: glycosyltransferase family 2 protein [Clostridia bacterium]|nr:glycosyltransferase family 2 protein [Clostridia bacterium]